MVTHRLDTKKGDRELGFIWSMGVAFCDASDVDIALTGDPWDEQRLLVADLIEWGASIEWAPQETLLPRPAPEGWMCVDMARFSVDPRLGDEQARIAAKAERP